MNPKTSSTVAIVIPSYNDQGSLRVFYASLLPFLDGLSRQHGLFFAVVIVDDGSKSPVDAGQMPRGGQSECTCAYLLRHIINLGQGAALRTGISFALAKLQADFFVTMDSDGQHRLADLMAVLSPVLRGQADIGV